MQSKPLYHYYGGVDIKAKSSETVTLLINPIQYIPSGQYKVEIDIDSINTGVSTKEFLIVEIKPSENTPQREYMASVGKTVEMPSKIDPRNNIPVRIKLQNRNPKNITELKISAIGNSFQKDIITKLEPLAQKTIELNISINPVTIPQKDTITWTFETENKNIDPEIRQTLEILAYSDIRSDDQSVKNEFLKTTETITFFNNGNTRDTKHFELKSNFLTRMLAKTEPKATIISSEGGEFSSWDIPIEPQAQASITITRSYRVPFIIFIAIVIGIVLYYILRSPIKLRKEVAVIGFEEGGISDLKVILHVKNRTSRNFDKVIIADKVPSIARIVKASEVGSLTPTKTVQTKDGVIIKWEFEGLEKHEERVFSYTIKSKLSILGKMHMPPASAKFYYSNKERKTRSNIVAVNA
ncbi:hypothetical protein HYU11_05485 [Candidatus Woesearchaeota archaeon]|nr:hypothetical protein [Candidatus Woesearchaeota archaeon]